MIEQHVDTLVSWLMHDSGFIAVQALEALDRMGAEKLASLGLTAEYPEVAAFLAEMAAYVSDGHSRSGRVVLQGVGRTLVYTLTTRAHLTCSATLEETKA